MPRIAGHANTSPRQPNDVSGRGKSSFLRNIPCWKDKDVPTTNTELPPPPQPVSRHDDLFSYLEDLPQHQRRLIDALEQTATVSQVLRAFRSRRPIRVATDGGLHKQEGTHGWTIASGSKTLFKCAGKVDGPFIISSSMRSELRRCASAVLFIVSLSRFWGLCHRCNFLCYCDSRAAISRIRRHASRSSVCTRMPPDADPLAPTSPLFG